MHGSSKNFIYKFKIASNGPDGVWYNTKIGREFEGTFSIHPDRPKEKILVTACGFFVPHQFVEITHDPRKVIPPNSPIKSNPESQHNRALIRKKISAYQKSTDTYFEFTSIKEAASTIGVHTSTIYRSINKRCKSKLGYIFRVIS